MPTCFSLMRIQYISGPSMIPDSGMRIQICSMGSVPRDLQVVDLAGEAGAVVGDDPLDHRQPVLDRPDLGAELGVLLSQQADPLLRLGITPRMKRLTPLAVERVAVLYP